MCAALANVEEDNWEWHTFDTVKGGDYLVDQDAAEIMCREAIDAVIDLEKMGLPFNRTPEGKIDQRRFGGHSRNHGEAPVRRSCYAADRTGHMILQTLFQNCVKHGVDFAFVAGKWSSPFWQVWDMLMLWLGMLHGFNGVRTIVNDYTEKDRTRWVLKGLLVTATVFTIVLGTLVIFTFDPCLDPNSTLSVCGR
jgi:succinate dehydrogenase hydrophobic anchor subunit